MNIEQITEFFKIKKYNCCKHYVTCYFNGSWDKVTTTNNLEIATLSETLSSEIYNSL